MPRARRQSGATTARSRAAAVPLQSGAKIPWLEAQTSVRYDAPEALREVGSDRRARRAAQVGRGRAEALWEPLCSLRRRVQGTMGGKCGGRGDSEVRGGELNPDSAAEISGLFRVASAKNRHLPPPTVSAG